MPETHVVLPTKSSRTLPAPLVVFTAFTLAAMAAPATSVACQVCSTGTPIFEPAEGTAPDASTQVDRGASPTSLWFSTQTSRRSETYGAPSSELRFTEWRLDLLVGLSADKWGIVVRAPWLSRTLSNEGLVLATGRQFGDLELAGYWTPWAIGKRGVTEISWHTGIVFPTGPELRDDTGAPIPDETQPGTGSFIPWMGIRSVSMWRRTTWSNRAALYVPARGAYGYTVGESLQTDSRIAYNVVVPLALEAGLNITWNGAVSDRDGRQAHTGGALALATVGVRASAPNGLSVFAQGAFPVVQGLYGNHIARVSFSAGLTWRFTLQDRSEDDESASMSQPLRGDESAREQDVPLVL